MADKKIRQCPFKAADSIVFCAHPNLSWNVEICTFQTVLILLIE